MIIGITGYIGSGKTTFSNIFKSHGFKIIKADKIGHKILKSKKVKNKIVKEFGKNILKNKSIDRKKLGNIVFNNKSKLNKLNKIMHPIILKLIKSKIKSSKNKNIIIEAALLHKIKLYRLVDKIILIKTNKNLIIKRSVNKEKIKSILKHQTMPKKVDITIHNNKSVSHLKKSTNNLIRKLKAT
tara:strand:- start:23907 stop:24458 length:552 start_codon:yes stop_codon:yes gene_type:complete